jgi:hypothetical protein
LPKNYKKVHRDFDALTQFALPGFTIVSYLLTAMKHPEFGLIMSLMAQPFWLYSTWKAYRSIGQIGMFITSVVITIIIGIGVINYWFL